MSVHEGKRGKERKKETKEGERVKNESKRKGNRLKWAE